jgi:hypothetical protein
MELILKLDTEVKRVKGQKMSGMMLLSTTKFFEKGTKFQLVKNILDVWTVKCQNGELFSIHKNRLQK